MAGRLARLERSGVIRGCQAGIDWAALGCPVVVYLAVTAAAGMELSEIIRELLLTKIFQLSGAQRTETFLSLADVEPDNLSVAVLERMSLRRSAFRTT